MVPSVRTRTIVRILIRFVDGGRNDCGSIGGGANIGGSIGGGANIGGSNGDGVMVVGVMEMG